jgi:hypothetical protein
MVALALAPALFATTVTMKLTGIPYGSDGPYNALINGTQAVQVVCDNIDAVTDWNPYTYRVTTFDDLDFTGTKFYNGSNGNLYLQAAWLAGQLLDLNPLSPLRGDIQDALWRIFDAPTIAPISEGSLAWLKAAEDATSGPDAILAFANYRILTPIDPTTGAILGSKPQEFIMRTPEGSALALLAGNLLGLAGLVRLFRKRRNC